MVSLLVFRNSSNLVRITILLCGISMSVSDQTELRGKKFGTQFVSPLDLQNLDPRKHIFNKESNVRLQM